MFSRFDRIQTANRAIIATVAILSVLTIATLVYAERSYTARSEARILRYEAMLAANELARGSDILTDAARSFAATGDPKYRRVFDTELAEIRTRDRAVARLRELGVAPAELTLVEHAKGHTDELIALERQAVALAEQGQREAAIAMVHGETYQRIRQEFMAPVADALASLDERLNREVERRHRDARLAGILALAAVSADVAAVLLALLGFYQRRVIQPLETITGQVRRLSVGERDIAFGAGGQAGELAELATVLADYQRAVLHVDSQRDSLLTLHAEQAALFEAARSGIVMIRDQAIVRCNRRMDEMFGYRPGEQIGRSTRIWYPDDATFAEVSAEVTAALAAGTTHRREQLAVRKDGSRFWIRMTGCALDPALPEAGLVDVIEDVTEQRSAAEALLLANEEQQAIFETATSGMALIRADALIRCNRRLHEIFGWPLGEMIGKSAAIWYPDEAAHLGSVAAAEEVLWLGRVHTQECRLVRQDGTVFWARLTGRAVDTGDHSKGVVWIVDDISAERAAIDEMRRARQMAEDAVRVKSDFIANISHEIRTPMNVIMGMTHLIGQTGLDDHQRDYLEKIQISSAHLLGIINDILDFSKIEAGKLQVEETEFELERVLDNVVSLEGKRAAEKGLELVVRVARDVPARLIGDPLRIGQILVNYVDNAVKFTDRGEVTIRTEVESRSDTEAQVRFTVTDTGIGLSAAEQQRLFRSFEQADTSTTRKYGGTGLGLAISKRLAELMGGTVGVVSDAGQGAQFWFTVRCRLGAAADNALLPDADLRGRRLLVVDDNRNSRNVMAGMLESMTFAVDEAESGPQAIERVAQASAAGQSYDALIIDRQMPGMDGLALARDLLATCPAPQPRMIMVTPYGQDDVAGQAAELGIDHILTKPMSPSVLFDAVIDALGRHRAGGRKATERVRIRAPGVSALAGARILVVEDNELNQQVARELLQSAGIDVVVAGDGAEALELASRQRFDAVLMDMQMPVMDGIAATVAMRRIPALRSLPILAMTANAMVGDRERCIEAGMNDHIAKPIDPEALWSALLRWLPAGRRQDVGAEAARPADANPVQPSLEPIEGVDVAQGLLRAFGRESLYRSVLQKFVTGQQQFRNEFAAAVQQTDWQTAERLAHSLKGNAAQIAAERLARHAAALELGCRTQDSDLLTSDAWNQLGDSLPRLLAAIAAWLERQAPPTAVSGSGEDADLQAVCAELLRLLSHDDFASYAFLKRHGPLLAAAFGNVVSRMLDNVGNFEFALAAEQLRQAAERADLKLD
jgi:two-component system sensor histidine kinase/response regulator